MSRAIFGRTTIILLVALCACGRTPLDGEMGTPWSAETGGTSMGGSSSASVVPGSNVISDGGALFTGGTNATAVGGANAGNPGTGGGQATRKVARWIATGAAHTCAVLNDGSIECWGMNYDGQLGDGTFTHRYSPVEVIGITDAIMVTTAYDHTCAILSTGRVRCWGSNAQGQLGNGSNVGSAVPVAASALTDVSDIDIGGLPGHGCARESGEIAYCWGNAYSDPNYVDNPKLASPMPVLGLLPVPVEAVTVGAQHSCALLLSGGVACWGDDLFGQLGTAITTNSSEPIMIIGLSDATAIAAGGHTTCAITEASQVQCWGNNTDGQLGNNALTRTSATLSATPVTVDLVTSAKAIAVGSAHACAVLSTGSVRCWGSNSVGQLGDGTSGTTNNGAVWVPTSGLGSATRVAAGGHHTCAIVDNGRVACWGSNLFGQLGIGSTEDRQVPVPVDGY